MFSRRLQVPNRACKHWQCERAACAARSGAGSRSDGCIRSCSPAFLESFKTPDDFTIREQTLNYSNGDSYTVRSVSRLSPPRTMTPRSIA